MPIVKILCTLLLVAVLVYCMLKKMYNITTIMGIGVVALLIYTIATGTSIMGEKTCGNNILDVFEFVATSFTSAFANPGLLIVVLVGFAGYMKEIGASEMLVTLACTPLRKIKSTYVICAIAFVIGAIIKLPITSPSGFSALMMITMFPIMVSCGVNPITAAATIALSQGCDWGPGDMGTGICIPVIAPEHQMADYFLSYNLPTYIFIIPVLAVVAPVVYRIIDKKEGLYGVSEAEGIQIKSVKEVGVPTYYALLPLLPIVFVLLFSKIGLKTVVMTTQGCTMLALFIAIVIELIRHPKEVMGTIQRTSAYFTSMGGAFASVVVLVASANCFAKAIGCIGGFDILTTMLSNAGFPVFLLVAIIGAFGCLTVAATSSYNTAAYTWGPSLASIAVSYGVSPLAVMLPLQAIIGFGRIMCPINASHLLIAGTAKVDILKMIKRNVIPVICAYVVILIVFAVKL